MRRDRAPDQSVEERVDVPGRYASVRAMAPARRTEEESLIAANGYARSWRVWSWRERIYNVRRVGVWRRLVAHSLGVRVVAGSNPATPTTSNSPQIQCVAPILSSRPASRRQPNVVTFVATSLQNPRFHWRPERQA